MDNKAEEVLTVEVHVPRYEGALRGKTPPPTSTECTSRINIVKYIAERGEIHTADQGTNVPWFRADGPIRWPLPTSAKNA